MRNVPHRDWILAVSMANLCLLRTWDWLLGKSILSPVPAAGDYRAVLGNLFLLSLVWRLLLTLGRSSDHRAIRKGFRLAPLFAGVIVLDSLRTSVVALPNLRVLTHLLGRTGVLVVAVLLPLTGVFLVAKYSQHFLRAVEIFFLITSPFLVLTVGQAAWHAIRSSSTPSVPAGASAENPVPSVAARPRIIWFLFDELDQGILFEHRPPLLRLPELERFQQTAFYATQAIPPGTTTRVSVPGMMSGQIFLSSEPGPEDFMVTREPNVEALSWRSYNNVFAEARAAGFHSAVAGWYFPYCRLLGSYTDECTWEAMSWFSSREPGGFGGRMVAQLRAILPLTARQGVIEKYNFVLDRAKNLVGNSRYDLIYVHWPIPHAPGIYDSARRRFIVFPLRHLQDWYANNLALVDFSLGEIRRVMEEEGGWNTTSVLITSDHPLRPEYRLDGSSERRVPFLLKLAGQDQSFHYDKPFNTLIIHQLILAVLRNEISQPEDLARWLDEHAPASLSGSDIPLDESNQFKKPLSNKIRKE